MYIPTRLILTVNVARKYPLAAHTNELVSPVHSLLAYFIHIESKNEHSSWKPFIDNEVMSAAVNIPNSEVLDMIDKDYHFIARTFPGFRECSVRRFAQIRLAIKSMVREFTVKGKKVQGIVPLLKYVRNSDHANVVSWYDEDYKGFILKSLVQIPSEGMLIHK